MFVANESSDMPKMTKQCGSSAARVQTRVESALQRLALAFMSQLSGETR